MEYFENSLCVEAGWLYSDGDIMTRSNYNALKNRGVIRVLRRACKDTPALVDYESIPERFKKIIRLKTGDPYKTSKYKHFDDHVHADTEAREFYSIYRLADGRTLPAKTQKEYCINAEILNAIHIIKTNRKLKHRALGAKTRDIWNHMAEWLAATKDRYNHTLPLNARRLYDRYRRYKKEGYTSLIHKNFGNDHSRKVNQQIESLLVSLACLPTKPYAKGRHGSVADYYLQFLGGGIEVADLNTGEIFNPDDFKDEHGKPIVISDNTVWNYLSLPKNKAIIDNVRNDSKYFNDKHRPHHFRKAPVYSLSKISLDDRDLPRKMHDGNRVKAYYSYDVASTAVIGAAYSRHKDKALFVDCIKDMFQFLEKHSMGQPAEVEVEHHIVNQFDNDLMKAGMLFPFVHWCQPGNSQEKRAEHFNRAKKYGFEKRYQEGIGRHTSKLEANRPKQVGEWHADGMRIKENYFTFDELVADDRQTIDAYNNALHPKQKLYPGKTRLQVLVENQNPNLKDIDKPTLYRYIGEKTITSIKRTQSVRVQGNDYVLSKPQIIEALEPNNYNVVAYWIANESGEIPEVYIYQNGFFVDTCKKITRYNESAAERTDADVQAYTEQAKYVSQFDAEVKKRRTELHKVELLQPAVAQWDEPEPVQAAQPDNHNTGPDNHNDDEYYSDNAINSL